MILRFACVLLLLAAGPVHADPQCWPVDLKGKIFEVPDTTSTRYSLIGVWNCYTPTALRTEVLYFSALELAKAAVGSWTKESAQAYAAAHPGDATTLTSAEYILFRSLYLQYKAESTVASNGWDSSPRELYKLNADGSRAASPEAGRTIPVGAACDPNVRVAGTNYHSVEGQKDSAGVVLGKYVALCIVTTKLAINY